MHSFRPTAKLKYEEMLLKNKRQRNWWKQCGILSLHFREKTQLMRTRQNTIANTMITMCWFLATVAFGLLSLGCFIFGNIVNLIAQTLLEENWTELDDSITESMMKWLELKYWLFTIVLFLELYSRSEFCLHYRLTCFPI